MAGLRLSLFHHIFVDPPRGIFRKGRFAGTKIQVNFPKAEEIAGGAFNTDSKELGTFKDATSPHKHYSINNQTIRTGRRIRVPVRALERRMATRMAIRLAGTSGNSLLM